MLDLTHQALQKGGECFCAHGGFTSQWDGASCRAARSPSLPRRSSLGSSGCECHLLGAEPPYTNYTCTVYTYAWCICVYIHVLRLSMCLFACRCTAFPHTCSWVKLWKFAKTDLKFLTFWGLSAACVWWHSNSTWALYLRGKGEMLIELTFSAAFVLLKASGNFQLCSSCLMVWQAFTSTSMVRSQAGKVERKWRPNQPNSTL